MPNCPIPQLLVAALAMGAASPALAADIETLPDGMARARIGDLTLYHDPATLQIEGEGDAYEIHCTGPECEAPLMSIIIVPAELTTCTPGAVIDRSALDYPHAWTRGAGVAHAAGLTVHVATLDQGCRNLAGSPVYACTVHGGRAYWFLAPGEPCRTSLEESAGLQRLLSGLAPATGAP